jgi:hypothetical protein
MYRAKTNLKDKGREQKNTELLKSSFGSDFTAKLKSNRRNEAREWRKKMGQGDASLRRHMAGKMKFYKK